MGNASATEIKIENINKNVISDVYSFLVDVQYAISHMQTSELDE